MEGEEDISVRGRTGDPKAPRITSEQIADFRVCIYPAKNAKERIATFLSEPYPDLPPGTFGWPDKTLIWAWGTGVGIRLVKLELINDTVLMATTGNPGQDLPDNVRFRGWRFCHRAGTSLQGRQFEICSGDEIGYVAVYVGETLRLSGRINVGRGSELVVDDEINHEFKILSFSDDCDAEPIIP